MRRISRGLALQGICAIAGVAAALLVATWVRGTIAFFPPAAPDGYLVDRSRHYTLYAPSAEALEDGAEEIRYAREKFRRHFGATPRKLVVFLADHPADFQSVGLARFRRPDAGFLPFLTRKHLQSPFARGERLAAVAGALAPPADGETPVIGLAGTGVRGGGRPPRALPVREGWGWTGAEPVVTDAAAKVVGDSKALAHEACHTFIAGYADERMAGRRAPARGYGHGALPDWFDEMAAALCESPTSRQRRRAQLRANLGSRIPLAELARMEHPITPERLAALGEAGRMSGTLPVEFLSGPEVESVLAGSASTQFYAQALSLGEFIFECGGPVALRTLAGHLIAGRSLERSLRETNREIPSIPSSVSELEERWLRWFVDGS